MSEASVAAHAGGVLRPAGPYVGLVPYEEGDAAFFFGRSTEAAIVAANLRSTRLTILYGPSGVGKSSLLMAGAVHSLREEARAASVAERRFSICVYRSWRDDPAHGVQEAARVALQEAAGRKPLRSPAATVAETLRKWTARTGTLLVVFDQFEEYFQYHPNEGNEERLTGFAAELAAIVNDASLPVNVLLSLREDAWAKLDHFEGHIPALFANYVRVDHLDLAAAREAIAEPIAAWNRSLPAGEQPYEIEPALVKAVLAATAGGDLTLTGESADPAAATAGDRIEAPFLQLVLDRLWRDTTAAGEHILTVTRLEALGGAAKIVENHLRDALSRLTPAEQNTASDCFRFLVSKSKTKLAHPASDLAEWTQQPESQATAVLDKLCTGEHGRILRANAPAQDGGSTNYELFHDILGEPILVWRRGHDEERNRRAARRRFARIAGGLLALVALFAALGIWALLQRNQAIRAEKEAHEATAVTVGSLASRLGAPRLDTALLLSLEAYRTSPTPQVESSMMSTLEAARGSGTEAILRTEQGAVNDVAYSPDGRTLASAGANGTVRLWGGHVPHTPLATLNPMGGGAVNFVAFGPDGHTLVTAGTDGTVVWDTRTPNQPGRPLNRSQRAVAFSPDGQRLATVGLGGTVLLWDFSTPTPSSVTLKTRQIHVLGAAFSPDGQTLATAGQDGTVLLWDTRTPARPSRRLNGNQGAVDAVAFSPDAQQLASAGSDGTVMLWDARPPHVRLATLTGKQEELTDVAFRDGHALAASYRDGTVLLWDIRAPRKPPKPLKGHKSIVRGVAFSPDGHSLASAGSNGTVRLWDTRTPAKVGQPRNGPQGAFYAVAFSADGRLLATAGDDGRVRLWDTSAHQVGKPLTGGQASAYAVAFSPDGRTLATGGDDGEVRLWNATTRNPLPGNPVKATSNGPVYGVAFSPDRRTLATAGGDGKVRLWDLSTRKPLPGNPLNAASTGPVYSVAFSPDGHTLASAGQEGNVLLWDASTRTQLGQLNVGKALVYGIAFSPDGRILATAGDDGKVQLWDTSTHTQLGQTLQTHQDGAYGVAFSPDRHSLAVTGYGGPVLLWEGILWRDLADLETQVCNLVVGNLTRVEWAALAPGLTYRTTCPS